MNILRAVDTQGKVRTGRWLDEHRAEAVTGDVVQGFRGAGEQFTIDRLLAPIEPPAIVCIGLNYRDHAAETGAAIPLHPVVFMKYPSVLTGPNSTVCIPACCAAAPEVDYEVELGVVIGRGGRNIPEATALEHVFGYTIVNDVSARRWQKHAGGGQWVRGKSFDGFLPMGPTITTADQIEDPQNLALMLTLNGEVMQQGHTSDMLFSVAQIIAFLSQSTTLLPGTVIATGTPAGVGFTRTPPRFLAPGDTLALSIEGLGTLHHGVGGEGAD